MPLYPLICLLGLAALPEQLIDGFEYKDAAAARRVWSGPTGAQVEMVDGQGHKAIQVAAPFGKHPKMERTTLDRSLKLDLSVPGGFVLEACIEPPDAVAHLTLYFHSGQGWYSASLSPGKRGWQTFYVSKAAFRTEESPGGWQEVDSVRIAAWQGQPKDCVLRVRRLASQWHQIALVVPSQKGKPEHREVGAAMETAKRIAPMLEELGLGCDAVDEDSVVHGALGDRKIAMLVYNPRLGAEVVAALERFAAAGGKLIVCYSLPDRLGRLLGLKSGKYVARERAGRFAEMRFDAADIAGLPKSVHQASWNITRAEPAEARARVIARWFDDAGQATGEPAVVVSDRGAFFSHILLADDRDGKKQLLAALLGHFWPEGWRQMASRTMDAANKIGYLDSLDELCRHVEKTKMTAAEACLTRGRQLLEAARADCQQGQYAEAVQQARNARAQLVESYCRAAGSRAGEGRAVWNHSGTGAYPGDWERSARELAAAGFNMVVPNMLWGGLAHYASDVLPRSATFDRYGDQIAQCVAAAHRHGVEVHVWKVNWNLSNAPKPFIEQMRAAGRTTVSLTGQPHDWLCPSHPENLKLEVESMLEVARKYEVDGLHFDYIRYSDGSYCYCDGCRKRFEAQTGRPVPGWPKECHSGARREEYRQWRCQQITRLVETVSREAKKIRPGMKISAAVFGSYPSCRESVGQDWVAWIRSGDLDFVCPMDYTESDLGFSTLVENQLRLVEGRIPMYPGIGATAPGILSPDRVVGQIECARRLGAGGFTIFNYQESTAAETIPGVALGATSQRAIPPHHTK
jgi:uncharacterized lipoprotein YddW (UPF0748 family)